MWSTLSKSTMVQLPHKSTRSIKGKATHFLQDHTIPKLLNTKLHKWLKLQIQNSKIYLKNNQ